MRKILMMFVILLSTGCMVGSTATTPVEGYLSSYTNLEYEVLLDMEKVIEEEDLTSDQKDIYRSILKKQYQDLSYEIVNETYDENEATVEVKITVYDYYKIEKESADYLKNNVDEFYNSNNEYDHSLYMDYKLNSLRKAVDRVEYILEFEVVNEDDIWKLNTVSEIDLEKIHGIYNYEE